jgi:predicted lipid-binding transport protein (Tim44 family)
VLFKDAYNAFLSGDREKLEKMTNEQALEYFKAHLKLNETKVSF